MTTEKSKNSLFPLLTFQDLKREIPRLSLFFTDIIDFVEECDGSFISKEGYEILNDPEKMVKVHAEIEKYRANYNNKNSKYYRGKQHITVDFD